MDKKNAEQQSGQSPPELIEDAATLAGGTGGTSAKQEKQQPSRTGRFFRKLLIWLVVIVIAFSSGMAADHFLRYKPLSAANVEVQTALDQAQRDLGDLQASVDQLMVSNQEAGDSLAELGAEKKALQDEIAATTTHLELLQVLVDVSNTRVALFLDDVEGAKATLVNTQQRLGELLPRIAEYDPALAQDMPQRLNLIISGLDRDTGTVNIDLELLTGDLLGIEKALFGG